MELSYILDCNISSLYFVLISMIRIKNLQRRNVDLMESTLIYALETVANLIAGGLNEIAQQALEQNYVLARSDLN